jgi:hypothetical protein
VTNALRARQSKSIKGVNHMKASFKAVQKEPLVSGPIGTKVMRSVLAFGLSIALSASAEAATMHHHRTRHHVIISPNVASSYAAVPGWESAPPRTRYNDTPSYDDPSRFGGGEALPVH